VKHCLLLLLASNTSLQGAALWLNVAKGLPKDKAKERSFKLIRGGGLILLYEMLSTISVVIPEGSLH
jgi:hypothetical protein